MNPLGMTPRSAVSGSRKSGRGARDPHHVRLGAPRSEARGRHAFAYVVYHPGTIAVRDHARVRYADAEGVLPLLLQVSRVDA